MCLCYCWVRIYFEAGIRSREVWSKLRRRLKPLHSGQPLLENKPISPEGLVAGGLLFLFNRKAVRFFRKDGHEWRKKADGKTVRETHEKLKVRLRRYVRCSDLAAFPDAMIMFQRSSRCRSSGGVLFQGRPEFFHFCRLETRKCWIAIMPTLKLRKLCR